MCIAVIKKQKESFVMAFNRDEKRGKKWDHLDYHWSRYKGIRGYYDSDSGGTWLAYNEYGIVGCIINREMKFPKSKKSRAYIVLELLSRCICMEEIFITLNQLDFREYNLFNLVFLNKEEGVYYTNYNRGEIRRFKKGTFLINRSFPNDWEEARIRNNYYFFFNSKEINKYNFEYWEKRLTKKGYCNSQKEEKEMWLKSNEWETLSSCIVFVRREIEVIEF